MAAVTLSCGQCGASLVFDGVRSQNCPYCASPNFVERPAGAGHIDPTFVVTFTGDDAVARRQLDTWLRSRSLFSDGRIKRARVEGLRGVYLPAYLYSAVSHSDYSVMIGEDYRDTETYTTTDSEGNTTTHPRTVTRTERRALAGRFMGYVSDVVVSASAGLSNNELEAVEPFDLKQLRRFTPALVSGWITEDYSRAIDECTQLSRGEAADQVGRKLGPHMPGDSFSDLTFKTTVQWESMEPVLVPIWVLAVRYREDKPPLRVVINGQSGKITGDVPLSVYKILITIGVVIAAIVAIVIATRAGH
ncbi:hypothetical protein BH11MYX3_BH11MYX3_32560 [soil metagenome]